jgi:diguanylate cyclase (GGDEF)-like protein
MSAAELPGRVRRHDCRPLSQFLRPVTSLERVRLLFLVLAVASVAAAAAAALVPERSPVVRAAAILIALGLCVYWVAGHQRSRFVPAAEPVEAAAVLVLLAMAPGDPFLPLFGLIFRSLFGSVALTWARYGLWVAALLLAHADRGPAELHADLARAFGLAVAPGILTYLRVALERSEHDALHDPLTGLPNRRGLFTHLHQALADGAPFALLLVDLDHFKELNDTLGHAAGDELLRELGPRLTGAVPASAFVARLGGDEFAVVLGGGEEGAIAAARRIRDAIEDPYPYEGLRLLVEASVGVALHHGTGGDAETLMRHADVAMYAAKAGGLGWQLYCAARDGHSKDRLALVGELPDAIADGQLVVEYQPKIDLRSGAVAGVEALVRWQHPERGLLGPGAFIPLAERTGLMRPLTLHVLDQALAQAAQWEAEGLDLHVAINLSAPNLLDPRLAGDVERLLTARGVPPQRLVLEITETIVGADPVRVGEVLAALRELGVSLALDDFGTGSSSLGNLRRLPVDELKIDKSFILGMEDDPEAAAIVRTTICLAHDLGLRAVAEGIENELVAHQLQRFGCDLAQGFHFARPMSPEAVAGFVRSTGSPRACGARHEAEVKAAEVV